MEKPISVYRASAGSGKTHRLTGEYIKLLFTGEEAYKHILAVTFTNKATDEMKQRILQELYHLSGYAVHRRHLQGEKPKSDYMKELVGLAREQDMQKGAGEKSDLEYEKEVGNKALGVLVKILHDYSAFSVSTIDAFFQTVMRAFARELGRIATYNVELDSDTVLENAVDRMFADLDREENQRLLKWLIDFSLDSIDEGEPWNIRGKIDRLAQSLFSEEFKLKSRDYTLSRNEQMEQVVQLKERIKLVEKTFKTKCIALGKKGEDCMSHCGLTYNTFKGGLRSPFALFGKLAGGEIPEKPLNKTFVALYNNLELWCKKGEESKFTAVYNGGLNDCVGELIRVYEQEFPLYLTVLQIKKNLNTLGILGDIYVRILDYCKEKNVVLISETTELLGKIIDGGDMPFVYEKVGTWIDHFMLDEFQDTSVMQWRNFSPLLHNSIAGGNKNLIVGDVKQSIYRWRGSDWSILNAGIGEEFKGLIEDCSLDTNWRSGKCIIEFNNCFFETAARIAQDCFNGGDDAERTVDGGFTNPQMHAIVDIYSRFRQQVPDKGAMRPGYVEVNFICKDAGEDDPVDYSRVWEELLLKNIRRLLDHGYRQQDIAILTRTKKEGATAARSLLRSGYSVVSLDSLLVGSSAAVQRVVNILKVQDNPDDTYLTIYSMLSAGNGAGIVPSEQVERLKKMPLYQMCEEVIRLYLSDDQKEDMAFIQAFLDMVLEFSASHGSSLTAFLKWWDESGMTKAISAPDGQDAVKVMTIHKSKGLAFEAVILPYFNIELDNDVSGGRGPRLWSTAASGVLDYQGPLPIAYGQGLDLTLFRDDYRKEKLSAFVDNLNIAYVAFTRAKQELVVLAPEPKGVAKKGTYTISSVADILYHYYQTMLEKEVTQAQMIERTVLLEEQQIVCKGFAVGEPTEAQERAERTDIACRLEKQMLEPLDLTRIRTSLQSGSVNEELSLRDNGIIMHDLFAGINTAADVDSLPDGSVKEQVYKMIDFVKERGWFTDEYRVLRECSIVNPDGSILRPDRVLVKGKEATVIDYKFGEYTPENKKYHKQVRRYMQLLMDMGYTVVNGYVWYMKEFTIENVTFSYDFS